MWPPIFLGRIERDETLLRIVREHGIELPRPERVEKNNKIYGIDGFEKIYAFPKEIIKRRGLIPLFLGMFKGFDEMAEKALKE